MITCREFDQFIDDYLDRKLSLRQRVDMFLHRLFCSACRSYIAEYVEAKEAGESLFEDLDQEVPSEVPHELIDTIIKSRTTTPKK